MCQMKRALLASAASIVSVSGALAADLPVKALAAQYMKICDVFGSGFYYIPGTDTCIKLGGLISARYGYNHTNYNTPQYSGTAGAQDRTVSPYASSARGNIQMDTRTLTPYGTLRAMTSMHFQNQAQNESFNTARAFIQWAGFTFGRAQAYTDGWYISGGWTNLSFRGSYQTGPNGINLMAYSFALSNDTVLTVEALERNAKSLTNFSSATALKVGAEPATSQAGEKWPDLGISVRHVGNWGYVQVGAIAHDVAATYYTGACAGVQAGTTQCGHPNDKVGWGVNFSTELRLPQFGPGDRAGFAIWYGQGFGAWSAGNNLASPALFKSGNTVASGFQADGYYVDGSQIQLTTGWNVQVGYEHFWSRILHQTFLFGYNRLTHDGVTKNWYLGAVCGVAGTGAAAQGTIAATLLTNSCNPDYSFWQVASRMQWDPVPGFSLQMTLGWTQVVSGFNGTATLSGLQGARPTGVYNIGSQGNFSGTIVAQRLFNSGGAAIQ